MTAHSSAEPPAAEILAVEELLRALTKGQRALQMYLPNNPVYQRAFHQITDAFAPVWSWTSRLVLDVKEDQITWEGAPVFQQGGKAEGLAWQLYKDGLRQLTFSPGAEEDEIFRFLRVVNRARILTADSTDDLLTLLWEQEFVLVTYAFVEVSGDGVEFSRRGDPGAATPAGSADARADVAAGPQAGAQADDRPGTVDLADFDATPYFLDEAEIRLVQSELEDEYRRDIRAAAIDALMDILETERDVAVREEVVELLDDILPVQLGTGGFRVVARILRELRTVAVRAPGLSAELHRAVLSFEHRLSSPEILEQLFRVLGDSEARPSDEDVGEVLRELKPAALPVVLAHLGRIADPAVRRTLEASVEAIARTQPDAVTDLLNSGPDEALAPAIALAGRLGLGQVVPAIIDHLRRGDEIVRLAAVRALGQFGTPTAIAALETALADPERGVRQAALSLLLGRGGSGGLLQRLESMLGDGPEQSWERSERRAIFEAYGSLAGPAAIPRLRELLEPRGIFRRRPSPDVRASSLFALGKVGSLEARGVVERCTGDKDAVVRSAANAVLREWPA